MDTQSSLDAAHSVIHRTGVPAGWTVDSLGARVDIVGGGTPDREEGSFWRNGSIPWITPTDLTKNDSKNISSGAEFISEQGLRSSNATLVPTGSIVFSTRGTVGNMAIARIPLTCNQSCEMLVPKKDMASGEFLYYLLNFGLSAFLRLSGGTTFGAITRRDIARVKFSFPPLEEQAAIARILDAVDSAIERTREAVERARTSQVALISEAFVRLIAPKVRLGSHISDIRYGTSQASSKRGWGNPTLRIPNVVGDKLDLEDIVYVAVKPADLGRLALSNGDLLLVRTNGNPNYIGRSAVFFALDSRTWIYASYLIRVQLKSGLLPEYVNVFLSTERGRRELLRRVTTSAGNHNINANSIRLLAIPVPKPASQQEIVEIGVTCRAYVAAMEKKLVALTVLKTALMHDLITGRVRVRDVAGSVEAMAGG